MMNKQNSSIIDKIKNFFTVKLQYTKDELKVKEAVELLLTHPASKYRFAPKSTDILIKNVEKDYYLVLSGSKIVITNHNYINNDYFRASFVEEIREMIFEKMEQQRQEAIAEIFQNKLNLLDTIIENLKS